MSDGTNEVTIRVTTEDVGKAARDKIRAENKALGDTRVRIPVTAANPIDQAWRNQVHASIRAIAKQSLKIPATPDTEQYKADLYAALGQLSATAKQRVPAELAEGEKFKAEVEELVRKTQAEVKAKVPVEIDTKQAVASAPAQIQPLMAAIAAGVALGGPLIGGALVGAGVIGLAALGGVIQRGNPAIQAGWTKLASDAKAGAQQASSVMVGPISGALAQIDGLLVSQQPQFTSLFTGAAQSVAPLAAGLGSLESNALPGLDNAMAHSYPIAQGLATLFGDFGHVITDVSNSVATHAGAMGSDLSATGDAVHTTGQALGSLIGVSTDLATGVLPVLNGGLHVVASTLGFIETSLGPLTSGLGFMGSAAGLAFLGFKGLDLAKTGIANLGEGMGKASAGLSAFGAKVEESHPKLASLAQGTSSLIDRMGPGGLIGVAGAVVAGFAVYNAVMGDTTRQEQQLTASAGSLTAALQASAGAMSSGVTSALIGVAQQTQDTGRGFDALGIRFGDSTQSLAADLHTSGVSMGAFTDAVEKGGEPLALLEAHLKDQAWNNPDANIRKAAAALSAALPGIVSAFGQAKTNAADLGNATGQAAGAASQFQTQWSAAANSIVSGSAKFDAATAGIKALADAQVAAGGAYFQAQQSYRSIDQAVVTSHQAMVTANNGVTAAQHGVEQAAAGVSSALHSEESAARAVTSAQQGVANAQQGVANAQYTYNQSLQGEETAQRSLTAARLAAQQQLEALQRQVTDSADTQHSAQVRLFDAQKAVDAAHLTGRSVDSLGGLDSQNRAAYQLLSDLEAAQHNLNDVTAANTDLQEQNNSAKRAGIDGNTGVISATQAVANAQHATGQAAIGLATAQQGVATASQAVKDAQYAEQQAHVAVGTAVYGETTAQQGLASAEFAASTASHNYTDAMDAASRSTDITTAAGWRNFQAVEQMFVANEKVTPSIQAARDMTEQEGAKFGFTRGQIDNVIGSLNGLDGKSARFYIAGVPTVDFNQLINDARAQGVDPRGLSLQGPGSHRALAAGGLIEGPGTGTSDSVLAMSQSGPLRVSNGEWVTNAASTRKHRGLLEAINADALPGLANGGLVAANAHLAGVDAGVQALSDTFTVLGYKGMPNVGANPPPAPAYSGGGGGFGGAGAVSGARGSNEAIVQQVFEQMYGWGHGPEWDASRYVEMRESGFNNTAQNPTSTAYGMFQFLDSTWGGYGVAKTSDPTQQSIAGARYIRARYGDPLGAAAHERAFNWYGNGGPVGGAGLIGVGDQGPELIRVPGGSQVMPAANAEQAMREGAPAASVVTVEFAGDTSGALATVIMRLVREGQIQLAANGQRVTVG